MERDNDGATPLHFAAARGEDTHKKFLHRAISNLLQVT